jgi:hypothetical protein
MDTKKKQSTFTTPVGVARWPKLHEPGLNFNKDGNEYRVTLSLPAAEVADLVKRLEAERQSVFVEAQKAAAPADRRKVKLNDSPPWVEEVDTEGNPTGNILFKFKLRAETTRKSDGKTFTFKPALFDSAGKPCPDAKIGGGSKIRVNAEIRPYDAKAGGVGVQLQLRAVQVLELVEYGDRDASAYGFEVSEDSGWTQAVGGDDVGTAPGAAAGTPAGTGDF